MSSFFVVEPDGKTGMTPLKPDLQSAPKNPKQFKK